VWDELWSRLCHQGTVYSASYAALPRLTEIAERRPPAVYVEPLHLATAIMSSTDGPEQPGTVRATYAEQASVLNRIAATSLSVAADSADFVYALQALLATEVSAPWASRLDVLANEELDLECPQCGEDLTMDLARSPAEVRAFTAGWDSTVVVAASPDKLSGGETRALELAIAHARPDVASSLLDLFGEFECPICSHRGHTTERLG